jgi:hypothetical protein
MVVVFCINLRFRQQAAAMACKKQLIKFKKGTYFNKWQQVNCLFCCSLLTAAALISTARFSILGIMPL